MSFATRTELADRLQDTFIEAFNQRVQSHRILKTGIEETEVKQFHDAIRYCRDAASHYIRYFPDAVMLSLAKDRADTALVEFKCANVGVRRDSFLHRLQTECPDMQPPFGSRHDIYNIEKDALDHYRNLAAAGVRVIVVAYRRWHRETPLRAQFAQDIAVCNEYNPNLGGQNVGSGTHIANANFASLIRVDDFFTQHYSMDRQALEDIERLVIAKFNSGS